MSVPNVSSYEMKSRMFSVNSRRVFFLFQDFNTRLQSSVGGEKFSQRFSELDLKVSEIRAGLHSVKNSTSINTRSLGNLSLTLSQIKVWETHIYFEYLLFSVSVTREKS